MDASPFLTGTKTKFCNEKFQRALKKKRDHYFFWATKLPEKKIITKTKCLRVLGVNFTMKPWTVVRTFLGIGINGIMLLPAMTLSEKVCAKGTGLIRKATTRVVFPATCRRKTRPERLKKSP